MKDTLIALSNGDMPSYSEDLKNLPKIEILREHIEKSRSAILENLDENGEKSLKQMIDCYEELLILEHEHSFAEGFSLASKLLVEALT